VFGRLSSRWSQVQAAAADSDGDEEAEILENSILRLLTRDYLEVIYRLLQNSSHEKLQDGMGTDEMDMDDADEMEGTPVVKPRPQSSTTVKELSELGISLLKDPLCFQSIIHLCGM